MRRAPPPLLFSLSTHNLLPSLGRAPGARVGHVSTRGPARGCNRSPAATSRAASRVEWNSDVADYAVVERRPATGRAPRVDARRGTGSSTVPGYRFFYRALTCPGNAWQCAAAVRAQAALPVWMREGAQVLLPCPGRDSSIMPAAPRPHQKLTAKGINPHSSGSESDGVQVLLPYVPQGKSALPVWSGEDAKVLLPCVPQGNPHSPGESRRFTGSATVNGPLHRATAETAGAAVQRTLGGWEARHSAAPSGCQVARRAACPPAPKTVTH